MTSFGGEGVTSGAHKVQVYATEEQLRSVFSNRVVSLQQMKLLNEMLEECVPWNYYLS